jgi:hypothetical protein
MVLDYDKGVQLPNSAKNQNLLDPTEIITSVSNNGVLDTKPELRPSLEHQLTN